jgi:integrase
VEVLLASSDQVRTSFLQGPPLGTLRSRAGEIVGLGWGDLNWENLTFLVRRSVVHGRVGETKTEASRLPLPVDPRLADAFKEHRGRSVRRGLSDFVFANRAGKARWQESILQRQIKPAALGAGIGKISWHTFRHSYSSLLRRMAPTSKCNESCSGTRPFKAR